jgi:hypothetical protein
MGEDLGGARRSALQVIPFWQRTFNGRGFTKTEIRTEIFPNEIQSNLLDLSVETTRTVLTLVI